MANNHSHAEKPENRTNQIKQGDQILAIVRVIHPSLAETQAPAVSLVYLVLLVSLAFSFLSFQQGTPPTMAN